MNPAQLPAPHFPVGSKVRMLPNGQIGTVIAHAAIGPDGQPRVLVDRPHGHAGQATLRQHFDASDLEAAE